MLDQPVRLCYMGWGVSTSKSSLPMGDQGSCLIHCTVLFGTMRVSVPNGISFRQMALAGCTSVTDMHTDRAHTPIVTSVAISGIVVFNDAA